MKKLLGIFAVSALTILGCTSAFASNSVQGDADSDGILTAKDSLMFYRKPLILLSKCQWLMKNTVFTVM